MSYVDYTVHMDKVADGRTSFVRVYLMRVCRRLLYLTFKINTKIKKKIGKRVVMRFSYENS